MTDADTETGSEELHGTTDQETAGILQSDWYPVDCVLCPNTEETHADHLQHMEDAHNV